MFSFVGGGFFLCVCVFVVAVVVVASVSTDFMLWGHTHEKIISKTSHLHILKIEHTYLRVVPQ